MLVQELGVEGIIKINITVCKSWWKDFLSAMQKHRLRGFALARFKFQTYMSPKEFKSLI